MVTLDDRILYRGTSFLRKLNSGKLKTLSDKLIVIQDDEPLSVIVPWEMYLELQKRASLRDGFKRG